MSKLDLAVKFAKQAHEGQFRKGTDRPYIEHPLEVLEIAKGLTDLEDVLCAAVLHDVVEDAKVSPKQLEKMFGERVAQIVAGESENKREGEPAEKTWRVRKEETIKHLGNADRDVKLVCLADKLSNARAIVRDYSEIGEKLFERFNASKEDEIWYYQTLTTLLADCFYETDAWKELENLMETAPFGEGF